MQNEELLSTTHTEKPRIGHWYHTPCNGLPLTERSVARCGYIRASNEPSGLTIAPGRQPCVVCTDLIAYNCSRCETGGIP